MIGWLLTTAIRKDKNSLNNISIFSTKNIILPPKKEYFHSKCVMICSVFVSMLVNLLMPSLSIRAMILRKTYLPALLIPLLWTATNRSPLLLQKNMQNLSFHQRLFATYEQYREKSIRQRRFKPHELATLLEKHKSNRAFDVQIIGQSYQNRDIYLVKAGRGKTKILLWSQMHGDEATATMALLDIFNYLSESGISDPIRDNIFSEVTLYFVPMLNPDGAETFERRTAQCIDMNRDAMRLQTPEARLLKQLQHNLKPDFGFNLHDQHIRYTAGKTRHPATISFLAPPIDSLNTVNEVRRRAMQLIVQLNRHIQAFIPNQVGRWSDEFEPRAFGENMQMWGTSTVLIESGGYPKDPEKQIIRKLNFVLLLDAFYQIAQQSFTHEKLDEYNALPHNEKYLFNLLIRNVKVKDHRIDIGITHTEKTVDSRYYITSQIEDWGDLSVFYGYEELDASDLQLVEGKLYPRKVTSLEDVKKLPVTDLLRQGYIAVQVDQLTPEQRTDFTLPLHLIVTTEKFDPKAGEGKEAHFLLAENGKIRYAVVNGFLHHVE